MSAKDQLIVLVGQNASGDFMLRPVLAYHSLTCWAVREFWGDHHQFIWSMPLKISK